MARPNKDVEALLQEYADLLQITGGDAFKARAYEKAARAIGGHYADISRLDDKELRKIPNVGRSVADKVAEYLRTGHVSAVEEARAKIPAGVRELTAIPTLGPKKAMVLYQDLHVASVQELADAIHDERLRGLPGFGPRTEENLLHGIELMRDSGGRVTLDVAMELDEHILRARRHGVKFSIASDAHSVLHLGFMRYGVGTAQRAWLTKDDVINAWPLARLRRFLSAKTDKKGD